VGSFLGVDGVDGFDLGFATALLSHIFNNNFACRSVTNQSSLSQVK
jgi:hypothetical protein